MADRAGSFPGRHEGAPRAKVERVIADLGVTMTPREIDRVLAELGYPADEAAPAVREGVLAVIHDEADRAILPAVLAGIGDALPAGARATLLVPATTCGDAAACVAAIGRNSVAGAILLPDVAASEAITHALRAAGISYVTVSATGGHDAILTHDRAAAGAAIDRLVALGHRRIALVGGPDTSATARERELGYLDALADHGLDRGAALIASGDLGFESGKQAAALLLEISPRPTAILALNEAMAAGVLHAALTRGIKVPDALSVIGFGDEGRGAETWPPLSTIDIPYRAIAGTAALRLAGAAPVDAQPSPEPRLTPRATLSQAKA